MIHRLLVGALLGATAFVAATEAQAWQDEIDNTWRIGILGGENEADRLKEYACMQDILKQEFGLDVELYPASDYAGVIQALIAGQLESAELGSSGYAGLYLQDPDAVEPILTYKQTDGSTGYYSVMIARADSNIESLEDMEGKALAFADPNSTSGYLVPTYSLTQAGISPDEYFSRTGFSGGHEQSVVAVLNGQYDAATVWSSMVGEMADGYSNGILHQMVERDALEMSELSIIWQSDQITNGPRVVRKDLPQEAKQAYKELLLGLPERDQQCFFNITGGEAMEFIPVEHEFYSKTVDMRRSLQEGRRG